MTCSEFTALTKDLILSAAAITGAVVAMIGLNTWQRQLKGQAEYDLSRRVLVTLYKYRDAIYGVRNPVMWAYEMPLPPADEARNMSREQRQFYGTSKAYEARWVKVQNERASLYADLLEAEAIWGDELKKLFNAISDLEHELFTRVRHHIELLSPDTDNDTKKAIRDYDRNKRDILYDNGNDVADEFKNDFKARVENVEKYLKPKLTR